MKKNNWLKNYAKDGKTMQPSNLWETDKTAWMDSVMNANANKDWVQQMYNPEAKTLDIDGVPRQQFLEYGEGDGRQWIYPTINRVNGVPTYFGNNAGYYAAQKQLAIPVKTSEQADYFIQNSDKLSNSFSEDIARQRFRDSYKEQGGTVGNYWEELSKAKYGQNMLNMTDEQIAMVRDTNRVTDDPLMIPGSPRVKAKDGAMIKRADGSYSQRGLWDNIRANAGSGKKPTKEMLQQEKKIKASENAKYGKKLKGLTKQQQLQVAQSEQHLPYQDMDPAMVNLYQGAVKANDLFKSTAVNKKADLLYKRYNEQAGAYLSRPEYKNSPLKAEHIAEAAKRLYKDTNYEFPLDLALAQAQFESGLGTHLKTKNNVWNVGNYGDGTRTTDFDSPEASAYNYMQLMYDKYLDKGKKNVDDLIQKGMINTEGNRYDPTNPKYEEVIGKQIKTIRKRIPGIGQPYNTTGKVSANEQIPVYPDQPIQVPIAKDGKLLAPSTPYPDMDPAMLKQYQLMEELSTAAGRDQYNTKKQQKQQADFIKQLHKNEDQSVIRESSYVSPAYREQLERQYKLNQVKQNVIKPVLHGAEGVAGAMQLASFIPHPVAQTVGGLGDLIGTGLFALETGMELGEGNYKKAAIDAGLTAAPTILGEGIKATSPYIKKMFGKKPVVYGESNVAPHDPYSSVEKIKYPSTWQGPARTTKTVPLTPENAPYLTDVTPLTKEQEILKSFGLDPNNPGKIPNAFINRANSSKGAIDVPKQMVDIYKEILRQSKLKPYVGKNANQALFDFKQRIETPEGIKRMQELGINNPNILRSLHIKGDPISEGMFMSPPMGDRYIGLHPNLDDQFTKPIVRHEIEHAVQENIYRNAIENLNRSNVDWDTYKGTVPNTSSIDKLLEGIELKKEAIPLPPRTPKEYIENPNDIIERLKDKQDATDYFMYGSDGKEKAPFLGELQQHLVDNGYIKHPYDKITPDILKSAHFDHRNSNGYPIRILNIMKPTDKNYEILAQGLNKMLGVAAPVGLGAAALSQNNKKYGGKITNNWLQKY